MLWTRVAGILRTVWLSVNGPRKFLDFLPVSACPSVSCLWVEKGSRQRSFQAQVSLSGSFGRLRLPDGTGCHVLFAPWAPASKYVACIYGVLYPVRLRAEGKFPGQASLCPFTGVLDTYVVSCCGWRLSARRTRTPSTCS